MSAHHLKLYRGPNEAPTETSTPNAEDHATITVSLQEVLPLLADAFNSQRTWLSDFEDDELTVSSDLYEVLLAYQHFCRPSSA